MTYFINKKKEKIHYKSLKGRSPGIIFIHGLNSDMSGQKALYIERYAKKNKLQFQSWMQGQLNPNRDPRPLSRPKPKP